jgi:hypothetical protein
MVKIQDGAEGANREASIDDLSLDLMKVGATHLHNMHTSNRRKFP